MQLPPPPRSYVPFALRESFNAPKVCRQIETIEEQHTWFKILKVLREKEKNVIVKKMITTGTSLEVNLLSGSEET